MQTFLDAILAALAQASGAPISELRLEHPRDPTLGDIAFPCFTLAKLAKKAPPAIAAELAAQLNTTLQGISAVATGPYINFRIERAALARDLATRTARDGEHYGGSSEGAGKTIVIDFSSPNIAKPMHVGHIRSTIIGAALVRIFGHLGYRTVGINHIGDWGAQFGPLIAAYLHRDRAKESLASTPTDENALRVDEHGRALDVADREINTAHGLLNLYRASKQQAETDESFRSEAIETYQKLESGDATVRSMWNRIRVISLAGFNATYKRLGIHHDFVRGESFYEALLEPTLERVKAAGVTEVSQGALIVALKSVDKGLAETPCLLQQTNGTTLYATRDLAALFQRWEEFQFARCLYVVGAEQKLHFRQLKAVLKRMQLDWETRVEHVDFGLLLGPGRVKLASRKGEVLVLDDLIDEVVDEAQRIVEEKNPALAGKKQIAEQVGIGALVFNDLKRERIKDVIFSKSEILSFEGDTGPYIQFTHARLGSILRKAAAEPGATAEPDLAQLDNAGEILVRIGRFPDVVRAAAAHCEPSEISQYLLALAREVSTWLTPNRVLGVEPRTSAARLVLVRTAKTVLHNGLTLLGIAAPEEM